MNFLQQAKISLSNDSVCNGWTPQFMYVPAQMDYSISTRATLIQRLKDLQDDLSWQDFFDTYWKLIYNVALKGGLNETEAQEVVQETMISVARHMPGFEYDPAVGSFKAWLLTMTRWRISDQLRKRRHLPGQAHDPTHEQTGGGHAVENIVDPASTEMEKVWEDEWRQNLLEVALANVKRRLDPQKYQVFDLYTNKRWPAEKVASTFRITVDQVYMARHRITELIRSEVKRIESGKQL